jgi:hypothetical protein
MSGYKAKADIPLNRLGSLEMTHERHPPASHVAGAKLHSLTPPRHQRCCADKLVRYSFL